MTGPGSIHTTRQVDWALRGGCHVVHQSDTNPYPEGRVNYRFVRQFYVKGARITRLFLPREVGSNLIDEIFTRKYKRFLVKNRFDLVHANWIGGVTYYLSRATAKPMLITAWGSDINLHFFPGASARERRKAALSLRNADVVTIDATDLAAKCTQIAGCPITTKLIPLGIDTTLFRPGYHTERVALRSELNIPEAAFLMVSTRAFERRYGHVDILYAFAMALNRSQQEVFLLFRRYNVNPAEKLETELLRLAKQLKVEGRIRFMDSVPYKRLPEIYALADVVINFPKFDAFPVTFLEAAACGRGVITCDLPSYRGTFAQEFFRFVPSNNREGLAKVMIEILHQHSETIPSNSMAARQAVIESYNEDSTATAFQNLYTTLTGSRQYPSKSGFELRESRIPLRLL